VVHDRDQVEADFLGALGQARDVLEERPPAATPGNV